MTRRTPRQQAPVHAEGAAPLRLGFPVKFMGDPEIKSNDTRRWQQNPHLKVSLEYIDRGLDYLDKHDIRMYRMSSDLAPYATHPDMPQFHSMVRDSDAELRALGAKAKRLGIRLSFHPSQYVVLNSPDEALVKKSIWDLSSQAEMLDRMELGPEAVMVIHVGGTYGDRPSANARWVETWKRKLPEHVKRRLVLEHDDLRFSVSDILWIHEHTGMRLIFDHQHFWCLNPDRLDMRQSLERVLRTWPDGQRPKVHFSSPRTEMREVKRKEKGTRKLKTVFVAPVNTGHADFCNPFEFITFMRIAEGLEFDVMLEAKVKDLALIRLRPDLLRYAPDVASRFGLQPSSVTALEAEEDAVLEEEADAGA
ncbi:UV DNA damage repair endonuclease UvsE [Pseudoroseomonas wenyumeiae]|uniref:UV DNA damage repair endonuclease UvsE n=1 Tax=Teichococcus wenyumeiae TaxID=2478470 RepID=A0A3A9JNS4_9PROT|nr:UV DNA damage repair endonuclease UvsE [Pseudoroseomonas wenyumeiae]RKK05516.1 UV DNA damage repair endonuclease UvsE [Pseudoroseomonas wenyumeiae]RMI20754.1 UV DNA damage repair endonuclease UvsE [Pseudoroseomonas wenyumeiae]